MKNISVIINFLNEGNKTKAQNLFFEDNVLYSYGYHYPLCIKIKSDIYGYIYFINSDGYSNTTARHTGHLTRELTKGLNFSELVKAKNKGEYPNINFLSTKKLKHLIDFAKYNLNKSICQLSENDLILMELEK